MTSTGEALLAAATAAPKSVEPRLVYADWLDEQPDWEECTRCKGTGITERYDDGNSCEDCKGDKGRALGRHARAEFIKTQIAIDAYPDLAGCTECSARWCPVCGDCKCPDPEDRMDYPGCPLHARESRHGRMDDWKTKEAELLKKWWPWWGLELSRPWFRPAGHNGWSPNGYAGGEVYFAEHMPSVYGGGFRATYRRGFVEKVSCEYPTWVKLAGGVNRWGRFDETCGVRKHTPLREVEITHWTEDYRRSITDLYNTVTGSDLSPHVGPPWVMMMQIIWEGLTFSIRFDGGPRPGE